jgi:hypothetical protein
MLRQSPELEAILVGQVGNLVQPVDRWDVWPAPGAENDTSGMDLVAIDDDGVSSGKTGIPSANRDATSLQ